MKRANGFSLIELMVVIAIVAVLATIAVVSYKNYMIGVRMNQAGSILQNVAQKAKMYSMENNKFPNAYDLGLSATPGSLVADDSIVASMIGPYFLPNSDGGGVSMNDWSQYYNDNPVNCGSSGGVYLALDAEALGFDPNVAVNDHGHPIAPGITQGVILACDFWRYQGVVNTMCWYRYGTPAQSGLDQYMTGWVTANSTSGWDRNFIDNGQPNYANQTCQ